MQARRVSWARPLAAALTAAGAAGAACPPAASSRAPLCRNDYNVEVVQGPVLAPLAVLAMGGAYAAIADGVEGLGSNAAASAVRAPYAASWFSYDFSYGASLPGAFGRTDFDNRGEVGLNSTAFFYTVGGILQWGPFGIGANADFQRYTIASTDTTPGSVVNLGNFHVSSAYALLGHQLFVGAGLRGLRTVVHTLSPGASTRAIFVSTRDQSLSMLGFAPELGFVVAPDWSPWRLGATYRFPLSTSGDPSGVAVDDEGVRRAGGFPMPARVLQPGELQVGAVLSAGPRPLNPKWLNPHEQEATVRARIAERRAARRMSNDVELARLADPVARAARAAELRARERRLREEEDTHFDEWSSLLKDARRARYRNWPRARIQVAAEVVITGTSPDAVGLQSFLRREDVPSGSKRTIQPRLGIEGEPIPYWMIARVGTYVEQTRYRLSPEPGLLAGARQHFTFGIEQKLFTSGMLGLYSKQTEWRITFAGDVAPRYQNIGLSVGTWH